MSNAFAAFLSDSDSESGAPKKTKPTQKAAVPAATAEKPKARTTESKPVKAPVATQKKDTNVKPTELSKQKLERNPNREKSSPQAPAAFGEDGVKQSTQRQTSFRERGRGGRGGGRGEGRGGFRGGKREFDRHSGTGRGREMKKQGAGAHNWGDAAGEIQAIAKADLSKLDAVEPSTSIEEKAETTVDGAAPVVSSGEGEKTDVAPEVEEPPELTYEDFMKLKAEKRAGAGFEELKNAKVEGIAEGRVYAKKGEEVSDATAAAKEKAKKDKKQKEKVMVEVGFKFGGESDQGRGGYRGRGRGRGRGGERREFSERAGEPREFPERNGERREFSDRGGFRGARGGSSWERGGYRGRGRGAAAGSSPVVTNDEANFPDLA